MRRFAVSTLMLLFLALPLLGAVDLEAVLGTEVYRALAAGQELSRTFWSGEAPSLLPGLPLRESIQEEIKALRHTIGVELLIFYKRPSLQLDTPAGSLKLYNILRSISTMRGIRYYSASRKRMRTLYEESYVVASEEDRRRLPDPLVEEIPEQSAITIYQKDLTFGENLYLAEYSRADGCLLMKTRNLTTFWYLFLPMVQPQGISTYLLVLPVEEGILFYGLTCARTLKFLGLERTREDSFYNRMRALYGWLIERIEKLQA